VSYSARKSPRRHARDIAYYERHALASVDAILACNISPERRERAVELREQVLLTRRMAVGLVGEFGLPYETRAA
jgi:hypothetical protein